MSGVGDLTPFDFPDDWNIVTIQGVTVPGRAVCSGWARKLNYDVKVGRGTAGATITLAGKPPAEGTITFAVWTTAQMQAWNTQVLPLLKFVSHPSGSAAPSTGKTNGQDFAIGEAQANPNGSGGGGGSSTGTPTGGSGSINLPGDSATPAKGDTSGAYAAPTQPKALTKADALSIFHPALADIDVTNVLPPQELGQWDEEDKGLYTRSIKFIEFMQPGGNITATPNAASDTPSGDNYAIGDAQAAPSPGSPGNASGSTSDAQGATVPAGFGGGKKG